MKTISLATLFTAMAFLLTSGSASAATIYTAVLAGVNEVPTNLSPATGFATLTLNGNMLSVVETFSGLTAPTSASHIHCCSLPGTNAPVVLPFTSYTTGVMSGTYTNSFDLMAILGAPGEANLIAGLNSGMAYVNIHTSAFPGGEIEGFAHTPEPGTLFVGAAALAGLAILRRRSYAR